MAVHVVGGSRRERWWGHLASAPVLAVALLASAGGCSRSSVRSDVVGARDEREPECGNGFVEEGEACDDGNARDDDTCRSSCVLAVCGDGVLEPTSEGCDDGNTFDGDGCEPDCSLSTCGNGFVDPGETCDGGPPGTCTERCLAPACGDGLVQPGEECDLGPANFDRPAFAVLQGGASTPIRPLVRAEGVATFYDYHSASGHTGLEAVRDSSLYLYLDSTSGRLGLVTHHGIDKGGPESQPKSRVEQTLRFVPVEATIAVRDDKPSEFYRVSETTFVGDWHFDDNTDGGALTGLPFPGTWMIRVEPAFILGVDTWRVRSEEPGGLLDVDLSMGEPAELLSYATPAACRADCTIPRCGDATLDPGEQCDDGDLDESDGCTSECRTSP